MGQTFNKLAGEHGAGDGQGHHSKEAAVAKTAGFFVFSGIAMSVLKALNPNNKTFNDNKLKIQSATEPNQPADPSHSRESTFKDKNTCTNKEVGKSTPKTIDIVKGDTLWGLSRKYGVSIDAIKEANGLAGDTIYAGKKLVIP